VGFVWLWHRYQSVPGEDEAQKHPTRDTWIEPWRRW